MHAILILIQGRIPALIQVLLGVLTMAGVTVPEDAATVLQSNASLIIGGVLALTAFVPGLLQKKK